MLIDRKAIYGAALAGYYTFLIIFSLGANYVDIFLATIVITAAAYVWLLKSANDFGTTIMDNTDLAIVVFVFSFIGFWIAFATVIFSPYRFDALDVLLLLSPLIVWLIIWTDYYLRRLKGK